MRPGKGGSRCSSDNKRRGQGSAVQGPAGRKRSWPVEELKLAGRQCMGGERECTLLRAAAGWSPFRRINSGGAQSRIKKGSEKWERVEEKCKWAQMAECYKSYEKIGQKQISSPLPGVSDVFGPTPCFPPGQRVAMDFPPSRSGDNATPQK